MNQKKIIIIGGGASGMTAGISAARSGAFVTILEQKDRIGKKILSTGNGRCNFSNYNMNASYFRGEDTGIVNTVLNQFGVEQTISFFEQLGIVPKDKNGYLYPLPEQATAILDVLRMELKRLHVSIQVSTKVTDIIPTKKGFRIKVQQETKQPHTLSTDTVILACGGRAAPVLGSDGSGYTLAKQLGHSIAPVVPALTALKSDETYFKQLAGIRTEAKVTALIGTKVMAQDVGELQLTNYGLSGIPIFQISRFVSKALHDKKKVDVEIDFLPGYNEQEGYECWKHRFHMQSEKSMEESCIGMFHKNLSNVLLRTANIPIKKCVSDLSDEELYGFFKTCKHFIVPISGTNSFEQAQVCAGGVRTTEINHNTLESHYVPGLYLTGELLDIDGMCGGYNLQWAWATGYLAGQHAAKGV